MAFVKIDYMRFKNKEEAIKAAKEGTPYADSLKTVPASTIARSQSSLEPPK